MDDIEFQRLLEAWVAGDRAAGDQLYATAYDTLRTIAHRSLRAHGRGGQISTTVLVNECYLKLMTAGGVAAANREHFLALCARAMRQLIVDAARRSLSAQRGLDGGEFSYAISELGVQAPLRPESVAALDQALDELDKREPRLARIAECRIFGDMSTPAIARALDMTDRTVQRDWHRIKALLSVVLEVH